MKTILLLAALAGTTTIADSDADLSARVDDLVARWSGSDGPGGVIAVLRRGRPILVREFGMANLDEQRPNNRKTLFYLASLAKPFTAACAVDAARSGKLDLDASIRKLFPELPKAYQPVTLRSLLHHSSGVLDIYDVVIACDLGSDAVASNATAIELLTKIDHLCFAPGTRLLYSNSGYVLLAEAVKRATGKDLSEYGRERFYGPLGMKGVCFLGQVPTGPQAVSYRRGPSGWEPKELLTGLTGPGGMLASMDDLIQFEGAWWDGRFGDKGLQVALVKAPKSAQHPRLGQYAAGWMLQSYRGQRVERHFGGAFGFGTDLLRFPDQELTVITLSNCESLSPTDLSESIAEAALADILEESASPSPTGVELTLGQVRRFGRIWRDSTSGEVWIVTPKGPVFVVAALGDLKLTLVATSPSRLEAVDSQTPFALELRSDEMRVIQGEKTIATLERLPFPPVKTAPTKDYVGEYRSEALGATVSISATSGGRLKLEQRRPLLLLTPFLPIGHDQFLCDRGARIDFHRDGDQRVVGLTIHGNRAWGIELRRVAD